MLAVGIKISIAPICVVFITLLLKTNVHMSCMYHGILICTF